MGNKESKTKKKVPIFVKPDVPDNLQYNDYVLTSHELVMGKQARHQRIYLVFDPQRQSQTEEKNSTDKYSEDTQEYNSVIFLFHGTNELCTDTELLEHLYPENCPKYTWMDLAIKNNVLLIYPQSQTEKYNEKNSTDWIGNFRKQDQLQAVWSPRDDCDFQFISKLKEKILQTYNIKDNRTYSIGYSNGGIFLLNLLLQQSNLFDVSVSWGGGLEMSNLTDYGISTEELNAKLQQEFKSNDKEELQKYYVGDWKFATLRLPEQIQSEDDTKSEDEKTKIVIMCGTRDDNRNPSYRAWLLFKTVFPDKYELRFQDWKNSKHQYRADATKHVWDCFTDFYKFKCIETDQIYEF